MANAVEYVLKITEGKSGKTIRSVAIALKKTQKELEKTDKKGKKTFETMAQGFALAAGAAAKFTAGLALVATGVTAATAAYVKLNQAIADNVNELVDASTRSGIAVDTLAGLRLAAEGSGKSFSDLERGLDAFSKQMLDATKGTGDASKIFKAFGVAVVDSNGDLRNANDVFDETMDRLSRMENLTERNAVVMKLFGRSGRALIQSGAIEGMDQFIDRAKQLGPALDENGIKKAADFQRGMADLKTAFIGFASKALEGITGEQGLGAAFSNLADQLANFGTQVKRLLADTMKFISKLRGAVNQQAQLFKETAKFAKLAGFDALANFSSAIASGLEAIGGVESNFSILDDSFKNLVSELESARDRDDKIQVLADAYMQAEATKDMKLKRFIRTARKELDISFDEIIAKTRELDGEIKKPVIKPIDFDLDLTDKKDDKPFLPFQFEGDDDFGLNSYTGLQDPIEIIEQLEKKNKEAQDKIQKENKETLNTLSDMNSAFLDLVKKVQSGSANLDLVSVEAEDLKFKFEQIGEDTTNIDQLLEKIDELQKSSAKLEKTKFGLSITTDLIGLASGDILGATSGILEKTLSPAAMQFADPIMGAISSLASFGSGLSQAGQSAVEEEQANREQARIKELEQAFGRSVSDAEKERIKNDVELSDQERERISTEAMKQKVEVDVRQFAMAIETGLRMLPEILIEVLLPLLLELAMNIVKGVVLGVGNVFKSIFDLFGNVIKGIAEFFGLDSKRSGGRSSTTFTGSRDGLTQLHRNEFVVPESGARPQAVNRIMNQQSGQGITINVSADIVERDAIEELVRRIERRFQNFGTMQSSLFAG